MRAEAKQALLHSVEQRLVETQQQLVQAEREDQLLRAQLAEQVALAWEAKVAKEELEESAKEEQAALRSQLEEQVVLLRQLEAALLQTEETLVQRLRKWWYKLVRKQPN
jgi:hypothetical protein